tara:strand:+ start:5326 stop:5778 length:453 start_codon:yes stop_codon:yes gene_type:complete
MSGMEITLTLDGLSEFNDFMTDLSGFPADIMPVLSGVLESQTRRRFETKTSPEGDAWESWSPAYGATRHGGHSLLMDSMGLLDSLAGDYTDDEASVGSDLVYAAIHQFGGDTDMPAGPADVPARPYLGIGPDDEAEILEVVNSELARLMP